MESAKPRSNQQIIQRQEIHDPEHGLPVTLERRHTRLVKPERLKPKQQKEEQDSSEDNLMESNQKEVCTWWTVLSWIMTGCFCNCCLRRMGKHDKEMQQAWREKVALLMIIAFLCGVLAFVTFAFQALVCVERTDRSSFEYPPKKTSWAIAGRWYDFPDDFMDTYHRGNLSDYIRNPATRQVTNMFINNFPSDACEKVVVSRPPPSTCQSADGPRYCHKFGPQDLQKYYSGVDVSYEWENITGNEWYNLVVYNGIVLDVGRYLEASETFLADEVHSILINHVGEDITKYVLSSDIATASMPCLLQKYRVGYLGKQSIGCMASTIMNYVALVIILGLVFARFSMALIYSWFVARTKIKPKKELNPVSEMKQGLASPGGKVPKVDAKSSKSNGTASAWDYNASTRKKNFLPLTSRYTALNRNTKAPDELAKMSNSLPPEVYMMASDPYNPYVIMLVTVYSENEIGIKATCDSLAATTYNDRNKILFIVADGLVQSENGQLTADICVNMLEQRTEFVNPKPKAYVSVGDGFKQYNMAKVYGGYYKYQEHRVPAVVVVKCGGPLEKDEKKPGNRGKRDSQVILMNFLSKVMFDDRMTELEYDLFTKIHTVAGVTPDAYEHVLMVDADTVVEPKSLGYLVNAMKNDVAVMGVCGETRISNKFASWVSMIQVYEYFVSHHLAKTFESMFGGVTCLPGCFAMYRIKAKKWQNNFWVPILANPDVVETYSQNSVTTLHKKNLLMLGEDRFLTTLMLKTFPKRKNIFIPKAICKTEVPSKFSVLLSQRRRWINSTVHNLMELVLVQELCGTFCFSMQFVVALELFGTVVLPAAIIFTFFLIASIFQPQESFIKDTLIPILMLFSILVLPSFLVLLTAQNPMYFFWMIIYLLALPIWNFVLPLYAFINFDNFTWGKTREVNGEEDEGHGKAGGAMNAKDIIMKRWSEWEKAAREKALNSDADSYRSWDQKSALSSAIDSPSGKGTAPFDDSNNQNSAVGKRLPIPFEKEENDDGSPTSSAGEKNSNLTRELDAIHSPSIDEMNRKYKIKSDRISLMPSNKGSVFMPVPDIPRSRPPILSIIEPESPAKAILMSVLKGNAFKSKNNDKSSQGSNGDSDDEFDDSMLQRVASEGQRKSIHVSQPISGIPEEQEEDDSRPRRFSMEDKVLDSIDPPTPLAKLPQKSRFRESTISVGFIDESGSLPRNQLEYDDTPPPAPRKDSPITENPPRMNSSTIIEHNSMLDDLDSVIKSVKKMEKSPEKISQSKTSSKNSLLNLEMILQQTAEFSEEKDSSRRNSMMSTLDNLVKTIEKESVSPVSLAKEGTSSSQGMAYEEFYSLEVEEDDRYAHMDDILNDVGRSTQTTLNREESAEKKTPPSVPITSPQRLSAFLDNNDFSYLLPDNFSSFIQDGDPSVQLSPPLPIAKDSPKTSRAISQNVDAGISVDSPDDETLMAKILRKKFHS